MQITAVQIHPDENVASLLRDHAKGECPRLSDATIAPLEQAILMGQKVALSKIADGEPVVKYGAAIGRATCNITPGQHVHLHNLKGMPS